MNDLIILALLVISIIIIGSGLEAFANYTCEEITSERFVDDYYHWNWNDPNMIKKMNVASTNTECKNCTYSMSCDYTDDAQPFCYKSHDIPSIIKTPPVKTLPVKTYPMHNSY